MDILQLILLMLISLISAHFLTFGNYQWFQDKYMLSQGKMRKFLQFKAFWCVPCVTNWITLILTMSFGYGLVGVAASLINFIIQNEVIIYVQRNE